jgi:hypothetical protein
MCRKPALIDEPIEEVYAQVARDAAFRQISQG